MGKEKLGAVRPDHLMPQQSGRNELGIADKRAHEVKGKALATD